MTENKKISSPKEFPQASAYTSPPGKGLILFDGQCLLCKRSVQFVIHNDPEKIFRLSSLQSQRAIEFLSSLNDESVLNFPEDLNTVVYIELQNSSDQFRVFTRSNAIIQILKALGACKAYWLVLAGIIYLVPERVRDYLYNIVASRRYRWFGKMESCWLPEEETDRFL